MKIQQEIGSDILKVIVIYIGDVRKCPPVFSLINGLKELEHEVILCTTDIDKKNLMFISKLGIRIEDIIINYEKPINILAKCIRMFKLRKILWRTIEHHYDSNSLIWVISDVSLKHLGRKLLNKKYIFHSLELAEKIWYYYKFPLLKIETQLYGNNAFKVVVPEYNRAHLTKIWWNLNELPAVLPNKPYTSINISRYANISSSEFVKNTMAELHDKKVILYQGIINKERPLQDFIRAVNNLGDEYAFVIMSGGENIYKNINSNNYYFIPFIDPPLHLEVTSHAYIGVLCYIPGVERYSLLNSLYCAPNKLFEYSMFGIPMIGNDIPGLKFAFETSGCGLCTNLNEDDIYNAIKTIDENYETMSRNSKEFYNSVDYKKILESILE